MLRFLMLTAISFGTLRCLPPPPEEGSDSAGSTQIYTTPVDCNVNAGRVGNSPFPNMMCAQLREEEREAAEVERRQQASKRDPDCQAWATMESRWQYLLELRHAWADAYDLSPQSRWCLTNERSIERQVTEVEAACKPGGRASYRGAEDAALRRCNAFPED